MYRSGVAQFYALRASYVTEESFFHTFIMTHLTYSSDYCYYYSLRKAIIGRVRSLTRSHIMRITDTCVYTMYRHNELFVTIAAVYRAHTRVVFSSSTLYYHVYIARARIHFLFRCLIFFHIFFLFSSSPENNNIITIIIGWSLPKRRPVIMDREQ